MTQLRTLSLTELKQIPRGTSIKVNLPYGRLTSNGYKLSKFNNQVIGKLRNVGVDEGGKRYARIKLSVDLGANNFYYKDDGYKNRLVSIFTDCLAADVPLSDSGWYWSPEFNNSKSRDFVSPLSIML